MTARMIACLLGVIAMASIGCSNNSSTIDTSNNGAPREGAPATELVAQSRPPIADLPVPIGFDLDEGSSRNYNLAGARLVDHVYKGRADKYAVWRFYQSQMPVNRWTMSTAMFVDGEIQLDFEKESQRCRVMISKDSFFISPFHPTQIKIKLWTSGQIQTAQYNR